MDISLPTHPLSSLASTPLPAVNRPVSLLLPRAITAPSHLVYHVLPLSLPTSQDQLPPRMQHDLILPPRSAFASSIYPPFTTSDCTWQYVFDRITNPADMWLTYAPGSLGDYPDIKSLWQAWDEGTLMYLRWDQTASSNIVWRG
ncbi:hypothetical protein BYT27DRAFT_7112872 [Phlegmacium glaucopus]|nr:hypothetical protein BYT27DRAFT_7112872 [Phlegmacium glaucopus]